MRTPKEEKTFHVASEVQRIWNGLPVFDAPHDLYIMPNESDRKQAIRKNPRKCMFALTCERVYESENVLFLKNIAYVDLPDKDGGRAVFRFVLSKTAREAITNFDTNKPVPKGFGVFLLRPETGDTLERQKEYRERYKKSMRAAEIIGGYTPKAQKQKGVRKKLQDCDVRCGTGMVHFRKPVCA